MPPTNDDPATELDLMRDAWGHVAALRPIDRRAGALILDLAQRFSDLEPSARARVVGWVRDRAFADYDEAAKRAEERRAAGLTNGLATLSPPEPVPGRIADLPEMP